MMDERCFHVTVKGLVFDEHGGVWRLVLSLRSSSNPYRSLRTSSCWPPGS
jgi:hypothetical protein